MNFTTKDLLYGAILTFGLGNFYDVSASEDQDWGVSISSEKEDGGAETLAVPEKTLQIQSFPSIGPINRGFQRELLDETFQVTVMGQGKRFKKSSLSCFPAQDPGCYGVAQLMKVEEKNEENQSDGENPLEVQEIFEPQTFETPDEDLRVGHLTLSGLTPGGTYQLNIGYVTGDINQFSPERELDWEKAQTMRIEVPPVVPHNIASIVYGSCARIGKVGPLILWQKNVERLFKAMRRNVDEMEKKGLTTDAFLTLGDCPYMDPLGEFAAAKDLKEMYKRVKLLYGIDAVRSLMERLPTIQVRDDHEFWNDSSAEIPANRQTRAKAAQKINDLFQRPHGAETETYYQIVEGNFEAFVCDIRSERLPTAEVPQFMSEAQMEALKVWLSHETRQERLKPVFFSGPVLMLQTDDNFWHFKQQFVEFLNWIKTEQIRYLFFGTGDIHVGKTGLWHFEDDEGFFILEDASSALHKINHNKDALLTDALDLSAEGGPKLKAKGGLSPTVIEDHFTRLTLNHENHTVQVTKSNDRGVLMDVLYDLENGTSQNVVESQAKYKVVPLMQEDKEEAFL